MHGLGWSLVKGLARRRLLRLLDAVLPFLLLVLAGVGWWLVYILTGSNVGQMVDWVTRYFRGVFMYLGGVSVVYAQTATPVPTLPPGSSLTPISITVPVPDSPILWIGIAIVSILLAVRLILGLWDKIKP